MEEIDDLLNYGVETLSDVLKTHPHMKSMFKSMAKVIIELSKYIEDRTDAWLAAFFESLLALFFTPSTQCRKRLLDEL